MKKRSKILLSTFVILVIFTGVVKNTQGTNFEVSVGEILDYTMTEVGLSVSLASGDYTKNIAYLITENCTAGTTIEVEVTEVTENDVSFTYDVAGEIQSINFIDSSLQSTFLGYMRYTTGVAQVFSSLGNQSELITKGHRLADIFRVPILSTDEGTRLRLEGLPDLYKDNLQAEFSRDKLSFKIFQSDSEDEYSYFYEWGIKGERTEPSVNEYTFETQLSFVYSKSNGVLQGMRFRGELDGIADEVPMTFSMNYLFELGNYTMAGFTFTELTGVPFYWLGGLGTLSMITIVVIVKRKQKDR